MSSSRRIPKTQGLLWVDYLNPARQRRLYRKFQRGKTLKKYRIYPLWPTRLCSAAVDLGLCAIPIGLIQHSLHLKEPLILLPIYAAYFLAMELWRGRTVGKMIFGLRLYTPSGGKPTTLSLVVRTVLRTAGPVGCLTMLCWHRVTLLDLVTGIRVVRISHLDNQGQPILQQQQLIPCVRGWR
jgi:uncharacterized RDD family membrane protein YckC